MPKIFQPCRTFENNFPQGHIKCNPLPPESMINVCHPFVHLPSALPRPALAPEVKSKSMKIMKSSIVRHPYTALMTAVPAFCSLFSVLRLNPPFAWTLVRSSAHLGRAVQQLRAALYQLHQREVAAVFQPSHVHPRARRIQARGHWMDVHRLWHGSPADYRSDREGTTRPERDRQIMGPETPGFLRISYARLSWICFCFACLLDRLLLTFHFTFHTLHSYAAFWLTRRGWKVERLTVTWRSERMIRLCMKSRLRS